jgi:hypothetical protein
MGQGFTFLGTLDENEVVLGFRTYDVSIVSKDFLHFLALEAGKRIPVHDGLDDKVSDDKAPFLRIAFKIFPSKVEYQQIAPAQL